MKEGIGSTFNLTLLLFFILLVSSFALFATNFYRAFNVKNNIITLAEQYEGNFNNSKFKDKRDDLINHMAYNIDETKIDAVEKDGWICPSNEGWCYTLSEKKFAYKTKNNKSYYRCTYTVKTFVSTDIPIINRIFLSTSFFEVNGRTKAIIRESGC